MRNNTIKKVFATTLVLGLAATSLIACEKTTSSEINVVSREEGSGTRGAFVELTGIEEDDVDNTTDSASISNSTEVVITTVADDEAAIGYISLGSLNDTVKAVTVDGVEATAENVSDGSYSIARPFNIATNGDASDAAADFISYIMSAEGQAIIEDNGYIAADSDADSYEATDAEGEIVIAGSSSVSPVMEKLIEAYEEVNGNVTVELQESDSTTGMTSVLDGLCDIGMASRELKDSELEEGLDATVIAQDGIAVIVNTENEVDNLTLDQIKEIYVGDITDWSEVE